MSYFTQSKWWFPLLMLLIIANIVTISTYWWGKIEFGVPPFTSSIPKHNPASFLIKKLGFTTQQQSIFDSLKHVHQVQMLHLKPALYEAKNAYYQLLKAPWSADSTVTKAANFASQLQQDLDKQTFEHFRQVRKMCTPHQQPIFDSIIGEAMKMMEPPPPPPPHIHAP